MLTHRLDHLKHKSGRIWHCRIVKPETKDAQYYGYLISGPKPNGRLEWHSFDPQKILLDPYARSVFFPTAFDRNAAMRPGSNAGQSPWG
jgi:glycogen operon protein